MNARRLLLIVVCLFFVAGLGNSAVLAQDDVIPEPPIFIPPQWDIDGLRIAYQRVDVSIVDQIATTHVEQLFVNENDWMLEGTYLFPLPEGAAVNELTMWVDGQPIEAKILQKDEAREIYDAIVRDLRDPALLEYVGSSAVQANVFPIPSNDERRIEIEYSQVLPLNNGLVHYRFPQSTELYTNSALDQQSIRVEIESNEPLRAIYSPSHAVAVHREGEYQAVAGYEADHVTPEDDFELIYTISPQEIGLNLLSYKEAGEDGFFLLLAAPQVETAEVVAKDVILVLDTSGSMEGEKIEQARAAALYIVEHLNPEDRFNIIAFSTGVRSYEPELLDSGEPGAYTQFINSLDAVGGTNISSALLEAAAQADAERPTTIVFLTDGLATEGIQQTGLLLDAVEEATPANVRIFAFGVGNDVDPNLLDSLAENHRGTTTYVRPGQAIDELVSSFYAKVSSPVLANISLDIDGVTVEQIYPTTLPDLFAGTQLILVGRYRQGGPAIITLSGEVNGRPQSFTYQGNEFQERGGNEFIPRLWATRAIGHLLRQIRLHGENEELVQSVVNLSVRYGIITPYTSYLIEEDDIFSQTARQDLVEDDGREMLRSEPAEMVEEAAAQSEMLSADSALPLATQIASGPGFDSQRPVEERIRHVGSKTFVMRDGVWIDTAWDKENQQVKEVGFATEAYFDLLTAAPEAGKYLALGQQILIVLDDQAYQINENGEAAIPQAEAKVADEQQTNQAYPDAIESTRPANPGRDVLDEESPAADSTPCGALAGFPLLIGLGVLVSRFRRNGE